MFMCHIVLFCFAISLAVSSAVKNVTIESYRNFTDVVPHERFRRQSPQCRIDHWQCRDGSCIPRDGKCDGNIDCPDGSDETHPLCRNNTCQPNWFRCTYGACVDGTAPCNGVVECADQSDELLPRCRNDTSVIHGKFRCLDGNAIPASDSCDGIPNCPDGSDETVRACAAHTCHMHLFQCAYGACVDENVDCNGQRDCVDGSDEAEELCSNELSLPPSSNIINSNNRPALLGNCELPPYPEHGSYVVTNALFARPGHRLPSARLNISCDPGYGVIDSDIIFCQDGLWSTSIPKCVQLCKLDVHPSVHYQCLVPDGYNTRRACNAYEPTGTTIRPECTLNYYSLVPLSFMRCIDGEWNYIATCNPDCGRLTPVGDELIIDGRPALRGELPWHVGIYRKPTKRKPYHEQICGGSLVTNKVVISAAHCFWNDVGKQQAASKYAVAIAKLFREWDHEQDKDAQKSDLKAIHLPPLFLGRQANFQEDIAVLILETPFMYHNYVRPVCLDFNERFNTRQLQPGNLGKVAGWGLTAEDGMPSEILKVVMLPYVDFKQCVSSTPLTFQENITGDKICAGYMNGTALCKGDSGGGLAFPETERGIHRYYLRGVASTAPRNEHLCNAFTVTTFTQILKHEHYINQFL